jgi:serine/threonine-protein kinase
VIGRTISHYKILEKLGEGGMGIVYKAQDIKLDRIVALKFLPKQFLCDNEAKIRFEHEAKAASSLNHPNITTIHEIDEFEGECFIAMEYVEGNSLKELIKEETFIIEEVLSTAIQVAEGLNAAHKKGIVHRDIKSDNIMLTAEGLVKIMDFGLAKLRGVSKLTKTGSTVGTLAYMSPEQVQGIEVDQRSDIFSFGVVLYEMITGLLPFKGEHEAAIMYSILNETPEPLARYKADVPEELQRSVGKALEKNREIRYQNVDELRTDLTRIRKGLESSSVIPSSKKPQPSIAVLPFTNLSADKEQEYFCDGMAEEIINALTQVEGLRVVARTSAFFFKGKDIDIREIGRKLSVVTLLEGSVRKAGNRLRITAQLLNVADGYHLWSDRYDRDMEDIFAIQDEISRAIVEKLKFKLLGEERVALVKRYTDNFEAYNLYLKGRHFWNKRTEMDLKKAIEYFEQAIEKDPNYALAYAGLASTYVTLPEYSGLPPKEIMPKAEAAAKKALELDATVAEAHAVLGSIKTYYDWDWAGAESEFKRAIELDPSYPTAHHWYNTYLRCLGRFDEALAEIKRAQELDPLSLIINVNIGFILYLMRQYDKATDQYKKTLELDPNFSAAHGMLGWLYGVRGKFNEAIAELQKVRTLAGSGPFVLGHLGYCYGRAEKRNDAINILNELFEFSKQGYSVSFDIGFVYYGLGDKEKTFEWLEKAYQERSSWLLYLNADPMWDSLRSDLQFIALMRKIGLEK